jgi:molecular chaperone DnaJ
VRLSGEGDVGERGGPPGNLYIDLSVREHKLFKRADEDILYDLPINFAQAALGAEIDIPTLDGKLSFKLPPGTQTGKVFRLKGMGIPQHEKRRRGDQLVRIQVVTPQSLDERQRRLFEELSSSLDGYQS